MKWQDYLENEKMYVMAEEAAEMLSVSIGYDYKIIREFVELFLRLVAFVAGNVV